MRIFLVRHGETNYNKERRLQGHLDTELNEKGLLQAKKIAKRLKNYKFDKVYSSDLKRAMNTAESILEFHNNELIIDSLLRERSFGDFAGKKVDEVNWRFIRGNYFDQRPPNGESILDIIQRAKQFITQIESNMEKDILIVSHGGLIRALYFQILGIDTKLFFDDKYKPKNTGLYIIEKKGDEYVLVLDNCDLHMQ